MIVFIIVCLLSVDHIFGREVVILQTFRSSVTASSEPNEGIWNQSYTTLSGRGPFTIYVRPLETTFQSQDTSHITDRNQSQLTNRNQDRELPKLFLSRLVVATVNQYPMHGNNGSINVKKSTILQKKLVDDDRTIFKDEKVNLHEKNAVVPLNNTPKAIPEDTTVQSIMKTAKTNKNSDAKTDSNNTSVNVSLEDRSSFVGDNCPTDYAKINGKCVEIIK